MELLAAHDQENAVRHLQTGPTGKPLATGSKGVHKAPKTPGPFKVPLNDENTVFKGGKSLMKTSQKEQNAFVTPAGPRNRAPLGMKTTNAKARAFQTPAPLTGSAKTQKISPRLRRPKIKIHEPEVQPKEEDDVDEVEYMPPREIPLPDNLDEDMPPINWEFPMFKGANMMRGAYSVYHNHVEDDGRTRGERELEESLARDQKKAFADFDKQFEEMMAKDEAEAARYLGVEESPKKAAPQAELLKDKSMPPPSTLQSRSAAAALSTSAPRPRFGAPTVAAKSRIPGGLIAGKKPVAKPDLVRSKSSNAVGVAASKTTIGYSQGRAVSSSVTAPRKPLSNVSRPPLSSTTSTLARRPATATSSRPTTLSSRPTTAASLRSRPTSSASNTARSTASTTTRPATSLSSRPVTTRPRAPFSRSSSTSTNATLVGSVRGPDGAEKDIVEEPYRTAQDVENEMEQARLLKELEGLEDDDADSDKWMESFRSQLEGEVDPVDDLYEDFQFEVPEEI